MSETGRTDIYFKGTRIPNLNDTEPFEPGQGISTRYKILGGVEEQPYGIELYVISRHLYKGNMLADQFAVTRILPTSLALARQPFAIISFSYSTRPLLRGSTIQWLLRGWCMLRRLSFLKISPLKVWLV